jgi:hypothetical protein
MQDAAAAQRAAKNVEELVSRHDHSKSPPQQSQAQVYEAAKQLKRSDAAKGVADGWTASSLLVLIESAIKARTAGTLLTAFPPL